MTAELLVIVPSRGRPESVAAMTRSWRETGAYEVASLAYVIDADDPRRDEYFNQDLPDVGVTQVRFQSFDQWMPMVPKLNKAALAAVNRVTPWAAIGFMGDDHRPRTPGWAHRYLEALHELGTGIVYGDDLIQGEALPTQWAMTTDIVRTLGRMVPAPVEHQFCDDSVLKLGQAAGCIRYLPDVVIEHLHPIAGTAPDDEHYQRVNSQTQVYRDRLAYGGWLAGPMHTDVDALKALRTEHAQR